MHQGFLLQHKYCSSLPPAVCSIIVSHWRQRAPWGPWPREGVVLHCVNEISGSSPLPSTFRWSFDHRGGKQNRYVSTEAFSVVFVAGYIHALIANIKDESLEEEMGLRYTRLIIHSSSETCLLQTSGLDKQQDSRLPYEDGCKSPKSFKYAFNFSHMIIIPPTITSLNYSAGKEIVSHFGSLFAFLLRWEDWYCFIF